MVDIIDIRDSFGRRLRMLMAEEKVRSSDVARYCQMSVNTVYDCRNGVRLPNPWQMVLLAEYFDCSVNELLGFQVVEDINRTRASRMFPGENHFAEYVANRIIQRTYEKDITIEEISQCTGIGANTIRQSLCRWPKLPKMAYVIFIADALDCTPSDLLGY